jgi:starvation-inducible DNA-binding protein
MTDEDRLFSEPSGWLHVAPIGKSISAIAERTASQSPEECMSMSTPGSVTQSATPGGQVREEVTTVLQQALVELIDLGLVGKQLHWTVVGELFRPLHEQLDELVHSWRDLADTVAERIVTVGGSPDGRASGVASNCSWMTIEPRPVESQEAVRAVAQRPAEAGERTRNRINRLGQLDLASQDVLIQVLRELEKQFWMVRVQFSPGRE